MLLQIMKMKMRMFKQCAERLVIGHLDLRCDSIYNFISCCSLTFLLLLVRRDHFYHSVHKHFSSLPLLLIAVFVACHSLGSSSLPLLLVTLFVAYHSHCFLSLSLFFFVALFVSHYSLCFSSLSVFLITIFVSCCFIHFLLLFYDHFSSLAL